MKQVDIKQWYNPVPELKFELVGVSLLELELQFEAVRISSQQRAWTRRTPIWAPQQNEKRSAVIVRGTGGHYVAVCSVSNSPLTHNPFAILSHKVWEVYFSKCVRSSLLLIMLAHVHVYVTYSYFVPNARHAHHGMVSSLNRRSKKQLKRESETECSSSMRTRHEKKNRKKEKKKKNKGKCNRLGETRKIQTNNEEEKKEKIRETPKRL